MKTRKQAKLAIFEGKKIRRKWDERQEKWYFSVIDIIAVLTQQPDFKKAQSYWTTLKNRLRQEGSESVTKCDKLTDYWKNNKVKEQDEYAILTNVMHSGPNYFSQGRKRLK